MSATSELTLNIPAATKPRVVVVGGGFGAVNFVQSLPGDQYQVVMLSKTNYFGFWPLLYQVATSGLESESIGEPLRQLFDGHQDFHFRSVGVNSLDPDQKLVHTAVGDLPYDYLVLATGTKSNYFGNAEIEKNAFPLKDIGQAVDLRNQLLRSFELANLTQDPAERQRLLNFVIAGAGPTGVELSASLAQMRAHILPEDYPDLDITKMNIYLVEGEGRVLPPMSDYAGEHALAYLKELGVEVKLNQLVAAYDGQTVKLKAGEAIETHTLIWATGVTGNLIPGLPDDRVEHNRYLVNQFNMVKGYQNVFAIGDIAMMKSKDYPKGHPQVAPPAMQQGTHLAQNLARERRSEVWVPFSYWDKGMLAIVGRGRAVADLPGGLHLGGLPAWITWLTVHIFYLSGFRNKVVVMANWAYRFFTHQRGTRVIIETNSARGVGRS
ncbi:NADH dehydrogenase [Hymenobacter psoromatis]|nr:NADH dehydrogenase [Hymenobacter psoromatis]